MKSFEFQSSLEENCRFIFLFLYLSINSFISGYTWGYAGPFLTEGQLDSPEPACGASDIFQVVL